jgi:hypothetical protein
MPLSDADNALVIALVRAYVMSNPANLIQVAEHDKLFWVPPQIRIQPMVGWPPGNDIPVLVSFGHFAVRTVGGHTRRTAHSKRNLDLLACVCKQETLTVPGESDPKIGRKRRRRL